ncbi:MAG: hypothetical protein VKK04_14025 [Synechococcales bacterium]|nr:hypothetical protein [Synechococcales bacterium]
MLNCRSVLCLGLFLLGSLVASCRRVPLLNRPVDAKFSIQVEPADEPGVYELSGQVTLPAQTQLTVAAVRYLPVAETAAPGTVQNETYAILDYAEAEVNPQGWRSQLNLWEIAPDGTFQESWQQHQQRLQLQVTPHEQVLFLAILTPSETLPRLEDQLDQVNLAFPRDQVRYTLSGDRYIQVSQVKEIPLPTGRTAPPPPDPLAVNGGWGERYLLVDEPPNPISLEFPDERRTSAPRSPDEILR